MNSVKSLLYFLAILTLTNCSDDNELKTEAEYYFIGEIDNNEINIVHNESDKFIRSRSSDNGMNKCFISYSSTNAANQSGRFLTIEFGRILSYEQMCFNEIDYSDFPNAFVIGNYNYGFFNNTSLNDPHINITYTDQNGELWASILGDQDSNSTFELVESSVISVGAWDELYKIKLKCQFNCSLYNSNNEQIKLQNGEAVYKYSNPI